MWPVVILHNPEKQTIIFEAIDECSRLFHYFRSEFNVSSIFVCCDLNVQVTGDVEGITGPHVHTSPYFFS